ncbi:hypothetical protein ACIHFD_41205 [Nonomuraea sp. NPDC051941]|uniref:hypothetical protein n=1 Tax=Nonomuraea sp. NPDC051941 TaxID=3364373 RepID=UPI0037C9DA19
MPARQPPTYRSFVELATADPAVVGLVLKGSRAHDGMVTEHSDHDLYAVLADGAATDLTRFAGHRTPELDLVIITLAEFRTAGMPGFERYALARARVVLDRLDGGIGRILAAKARLDADEAFRDSGEWLDAYANSLYRSVKNDRDGHPLAARHISGTGDVPLQRRLFAQVEAAARRAGHGAVLDAWGEDLDLMRPQEDRS